MHLRDWKAFLVLALIMFAVPGTHDGALAQTEVPLAQTAVPLVRTAVRDRLKAGESLSPGQELKSCNGQYKAAFQTDGNFVVYRSNGQALWNSRTNNRPSNLLIMQGDGNLVIYNQKTPVWNSGSAGKGPAFLVMQDDGNLVIYQGIGTTSTLPVWASNTAEPNQVIGNCNANPGSDVLTPPPTLSRTAIVIPAKAGGAPNLLAVTENRAGVQWKFSNLPWARADGQGGPNPAYHGPAPGNIPLVWDTYPEGATAPRTGKISIGGALVTVTQQNCAITANGQCEGWDLHGRTLTQRNMPGIVLTGGTLEYATLTGANLGGARLDFVNMSNVQMPEAVLTAATLRKVRFSSTNATDANFFRADLSDADLSYRTNFTRANFSSSSLQRATMGFGYFGGAKFLKADLTGANLQDSDFNTADFSGANLSNISAAGTKTNFGRANFTQAQLINANLAGVNFQGARVDGANFTGANLVGATWIDGRKCGPGSVGICR